MRWFVSQSRKGGRCRTFNHFYEFKVTERLFKTVSEVMNLKANACDVLKFHVDYLSKEKKTIEKAYEPNSDDSRKIHEEENTKKTKRSTRRTAPNRKKVRKFILRDVLTVFDETSLY